MRLKCLLEGHTWLNVYGFKYRGWYMHLQACLECEDTRWYITDQKGYDDDVCIDHAIGLPR